ncbi:MAG TPA: dephospho-CoA kinase [Candidatus Hydrogenedentes bacterium]|nr:dephospho-CoA kinase [Candidatus Hydrogenedentota bacterium]
MRIYGLTGGTGSGKSEAARRFSERGFPVIDADARAHALLEPRGSAFEAVRNAFGNAILTEGRINRAKLGARVFADRDARARLNAIVHPMLTRVIEHQCTEWAAEGHKAVIIDAALLAESSQRESWLDGLILVVCPAALRLERLVDHRGLTVDEARRRIAAQTQPERKTPLADWVIQNDGSLDELRAQVDKVADAIQADAANDDS